MKHIIFGGNGFVGRYTVRDLLAAGEQVLVCDIAQDRSLPMYEKAQYMNVDITKPEQVATVPIAADDIVYNLAARMLHPIIERRERYKWRMVGENVASGPTTADEVMEGWLASPHHCENLMDPRYTDMGIAYVVDPKSESGVYWAQVFALPR